MRRWLGKTRADRVVRATPGMRRAVAAVMACGALAAPLGAQERRAQAERELVDQLLMRGALVSAESVYYAAVRTRPRDPGARLNLGRHVLARGVGKVAAALLEEARFFGGDQAAILPELLAAYERAGMWRAIAAFPGTAIGAGDKARAEYLMARTSTGVGADTAVLRLENGGASSIGRIAVVIGGDTVRASLDPTVRGVLLDAASARRRGVRLFARDAGGFTNVAVRVVAPGDTSGARIGLDWFGNAQPTIDPERGTVTVLRAPGDPRAVKGARVPIVFTDDGWGIVVGGFAPLATFEGRSALAERKWTLISQRGEIAVLPR
jgi:hypothetical protein